MSLTLRVAKTNPTLDERLPEHDPNDSADLKNPKGAKNTIELRVRNAFGDEVGGIKHYFAVYTRPDGTQDYIGGFPQSGIPPNGNIKMIHRPYKGGEPNDQTNTGSPDFKRYQVVGVISGNPTEVKAQWSRMVRSGEAIHKMGYEYSLEQNSNSFLVSITDNAFKAGGYKLNFHRRLAQAPTVIAPGVDRHLADGLGPKFRLEQPAHWEQPQQQGPPTPQRTTPTPDKGGDPFSCFGKPGNAGGRPLRRGERKQCVPPQDRKPSNRKVSENNSGENPSEFQEKMASLVDRLRQPQSNLGGGGSSSESRQRLEKLVTRLNKSNPLPQHVETAPEVKIASSAVTPTPKVPTQPAVRSRRIGPSR